MGTCVFVKELNKLRKSSNESIDHVDKFDDFKKYMHVTRQAELDLKEILRQVNQSGKKTLALLCGSAGDGKSHLLSYLKNSDDENLLNGYIVYNDATESSAPSKTAIETLHELLIGFTDKNIKLDGQNIILAMNLGVLNNFIESEYGQQYKLLREYVIKSNILTSEIKDQVYDGVSHFQHVSFSDYHMYYLNENGANPKFIQDIFSKVFDISEHNPFYRSYLHSCSECPMSVRCPVRHNYKFLLSDQVRQFIAGGLIRSAIKDKGILTTRDILNFIYDIIVSYQFSYKRLTDATINMAVFLKTYLNCITPSLLFENHGVSDLIDYFGKYDPLFERTKETDENALTYYVSSDVTDLLEEAIGECVYKPILCTEENLEQLKFDRVLKVQIYKTVVRISAIMKGNMEDALYSNFLKDLYSYNAGKKFKLQSIYDMVENGVVQWCGSEMDSNIKLEEISGYELYEKIKFEEYLEDVPTCTADADLQRFMLAILVKFQDINTKEVITLHIDYSLYELLSKLNMGYIQTAEDQNNHAYFISFITKILKTGTAGGSMVVVSENGSKAILDKTKFGYKFRVVK